jgi:peptidoglycan hydrolase CwlO-like protein
LEKAETIKDDAIQHAISSQQREIDHFKNMVNALRDEIDLKKNLHEESIQKENQQKTMEFKQLQETIIELRAELEETNER